MLEMFEDNVLWAFSLTLFAGLSTGIGSGIAFFAKRDNTKMLAVAMGFSAGVMIYVSFVEIFVKAKDALSAELGETQGALFTVLSFFGGIFLIGLIDKFIPDFENPHELDKIDHLEEQGPASKKASNEKLMRVGIFTALALAIHNFPEGMATFISALKDPELGVSIAIAIAIHNIPEGMAVSIPIYYATGEKKKAFVYSFLSGLAEPVGAIIGYVVLFQYMNDIAFGVIFGMIAGIMVFISLDQLLPGAEKYGEHHLSIYGLIAGMGVMAGSLLLF